MEYNQQRRNRNAGYNSGRQMNYGRRMGCENRQADRGCENRQMDRSCERNVCESERNMAARQTGCDSCARQMEREACDRQRQRETCDGEGTCAYMRQKGCLEGSDSYPIGMGYIPWQSWSCTYDAHRGLMSGTIFPELDKPFCAAGRCGR